MVRCSNNAQIPEENELAKVGIPSSPVQHQNQRISGCNFGELVFFEYLSVVWASYHFCGLRVERISLLASLFMSLLTYCSFFVGKVALEPCFSTHKMCHKSEHQKCRRYEKWILLAEYIAKVLWYSENAHLIAENGCFEVVFWSWAGISTVRIEHFWVLSRNSL